MTEEDVEQIVRAVVTAMKNEFVSKAVVDISLQQEKDEYIRLQLTRAKRREQLREKLVGHIAGWGAITLIAGLGYILWEWAMHKLGRG